MIASTHLPIVKPFLEDKSLVKWSKVTRTTQSVLADNMHVLANKQHKYKLKHLRLCGSLLIKSTKKGEKQVDIQNARMEPIHHVQYNQGIRLTKNSFKVEFYGAVTNWLIALKRWCVQLSFTQDYSVSKLIGKGNFAKVYKVRSKKDMQDYAAKAFDKSLFQNVNIDKQALLKELDILRQMDHPGVINLKEVYESEQFIFLVQDLHNGGELYDYLRKIKPLAEEKASKIIYNLMDAVGYIHSKGVMHRDLKPENLILKEKGQVDELVIADFGLADYYKVNGDYMFTRCGTPGYVAPEVLQDKLYDYKADLYSCGVLLYILLVGQSPFKGKTYDDIVMLNYKGIIDFTDLKISRDCMEVLQGMLELNPIKRLSIQQAKQHSWFRRCNRKSETELFKKMDKLQTISNVSTPSSLTQFNDCNSPFSPFSILTARTALDDTPKKHHSRNLKFFQNQQQLPSLSVSINKKSQSNLSSNSNTPLI